MSIQSNEVIADVRDYTPMTEVHLTAYQLEWFSLHNIIYRQLAAKVNQVIKRASILSSLFVRPGHIFRAQSLTRQISLTRVANVLQLAAPDRLYLRHDMVSMASRKDQQYCLWLFNDLTVFSCVKRKAGSVSRRTSILL